MEKAREFQKNIYFCFIDFAKVFDCVDHNKLWKILQDMGISDHLICLLRNLYVGQEATVRTGHGKQTGSKLGKEYIKAVYCHLLKSLPQFVVIHTVKGFGVVTIPEVDVFLEFPYFFYDPMDIGNLISGFLPILNPA